MTCKDPPISTTHDRDVALLLATLAEIEALTGLNYQLTVESSPQLPPVRADVP